MLTQLIQLLSPLTAGKGRHEHVQLPTRVHGIMGWDDLAGNKGGCHGLMWPAPWFTMYHTYAIYYGNLPGIFADNTNTTGTIAIGNKLPTFSFA